METPSGFVIHDLNTTNGTRVNRTKVGQEQHPLKHGDRIRLAGSEVVFVFRQESPDTELISNDEHDTGAIALERRSRDSHGDEFPETPMARMDSALFRLLNSKRGTVVSRDEIARQVFSELPEGSQANQEIDKSIERIREGIGEDAKDPENLVAVGEFGFLMV